MASQVYGTFFGIYARFELLKMGNRNKLNQIHFRIINYKGLINIGIDKVKLPPNSGRDPNKISINFILKGYMKPVQDCICDLVDENIFLANGTEITFTRIMSEFVANADDHFNEGAFDEEFYFRDGLFPISAPVSRLEDEIEAQSTSGPKLGKRCPITLIRIVIPDV
jgi:hypothetical protein